MPDIKSDHTNNTGASETLMATNGLCDLETNSENSLSATSSDIATNIKKLINNHGERQFLFIGDEQLQGIPPTANTNVVIRHGLRFQNIVQEIDKLSEETPATLLMGPVTVVIHCGIQNIIDVFQDSMFASDTRCESDHYGTVIIPSLAEICEQLPFIVDNIYWSNILQHRSIPNWVLDHARSKISHAVSNISSSTQIAHHLLNNSGYFGGETGFSKLTFTSPFLTTMGLVIFGHSLSYRVPGFTTSLMKNIRGYHIQEIHDDLDGSRSGHFARQRLSYELGKGWFRLPTTTAQKSEPLPRPMNKITALVFDQPDFEAIRQYRIKMLEQLKPRIRKNNTVPKQNIVIQQQDDLVQMSQTQAQVPPNSTAIPAPLPPPTSSCNRKRKNLLYPCCMCSKNVGLGSIKCTSQDKWCHNKCGNLTSRQANKIAKNSNALHSWTCPKHSQY